MIVEYDRHPLKFVLRVDQMVKKPEKWSERCSLKEVDIVTLSCLTSQYDTEVQILESLSDSPTREWIERAIINQYERLKYEKPAA